MGEFLVLAGIVKVIVDRLKARFVLDGDIVNLSAALVGVTMSFLFDINVATEVTGIVLNETLGVIVTGIGIGLGAGFLNDTLGALAGARSGE